MTWLHAKAPEKVNICCAITYDLPQDLYFVVYVVDVIDVVDVVDKKFWFLRFF